MEMLRTLIDSPFWKKIWQCAKNLRELWALGAFLLAVVAAPFDKPILEVTYQLDLLYPPMAAESQVKNAPADGIGSLAEFVGSRDLLRLRIRNNSSDRIQDLDLQIDGFKVADVALRSNSSQIMADRQKLAAFQISADYIVTFPNFTSIPPKAEVVMMLWGDFHTFLLRERVRVSSTAETAKVVQQGTVSGLGLFVAKHLVWFGVFLAVSLLLLGLRRFK